MPGILLASPWYIGTTTLAASASSDLQTGELLATADEMNPQIGFGEDIMARMSFANETPGGAEKLRVAILDSLNKLARQVSRQAGRKASEIVDVVIVGNTVMHHFFLGIDTELLGRALDVPALRASLDIRRA